MIAATRRSALLGLTATLTFGRSTLAVANAPTDRRFVVIILRGALDGMSAVVPYGDPALMSLRGEIVPPQPGQTNGMLDLGGFYGLHPALTGFHALFQAHEAMAVHAIAGGYRVRSHFEAQDYMESGRDHRMTSGWLNRVVAAVPDRSGGPDGEAVVIGVSVPLLLRGPARVANWAPIGFAQPRDDLYQRIVALNESDPVTGPAIAEGLKARGFSETVMDGMDEPKHRYTFPLLAKAAGELLRATDGPRIAALEIGGWDTHTAQANRLAAPLKNLDAGLVALKTALGPAWRQTVVLAMTEFGRTARVNGSKGTDHGTATVALLAGGAVAGGRVMVDWPGLGPGKLFENRDLAPTADLRGLARGVLNEHLGLNRTALNQVFPGSQRAGTLSGLIHT